MGGRLLGKLVLTIEMAFFLFLGGRLITYCIVSHRVCRLSRVENAKPRPGPLAADLRAAGNAQINRRQPSRIGKCPGKQLGTNTRRPGLSCVSINFYET